MDRKLLDLLCCPTTRQPLAVLETRGLEALNRAIAAGQIKRADDAPQAEALRAAVPQAVLAGAVEGDVVAGIRMAHDAGAGVVPQHAGDALVGLFRAVADDHDA